MEGHGLWREINIILLEAQYKKIDKIQFSSLFIKRIKIVVMDITLQSCTLARANLQS